MLKFGTRYIVTKASDDCTFGIGDHIFLNQDSTISCFEAQGWLEACDVDEAIKGMLVEIDEEYYKRKKEKLIDELEKLNDLLRID